MARLRLGVALLLPPPVAAEIDGLRRALGDRSLGRVAPHVTLVPPVNVHRNDLGRALAVLRAAAGATSAPLTITLGPPATFLPANPVLYLPVEGDVDAVHALRDRVWKPPFIRALTWPFVPHVTLADEADRARITAALVALSGYTAEMAFDRLELLVEHRPGPQWRSLADTAFGPPSVVARSGPLSVELVRSQRIDPEGAALLASEGVEMPTSETPIRGPLVMTARREGEVVGVAAAWLTSDGRQTSVFVASPHRRQGIGRYLDAALTAAVADAGWGVARR